MNDGFCSAFHGVVPYWECTGYSAIEGAKNHCQSTANSLANAIDAAMEGRWISVEKELPVLTMKVLWLQEYPEWSTQFVEVYYGQLQENVTHWMPLPPPAKETK
jgi:hypothetical protein